MFNLISFGVKRLKEEHTLSVPRQNAICDLPHEMSRNVPDGHFHVIFSESKFYALCNGENHFQSEE